MKLSLFLISSLILSMATPNGTSAQANGRASVQTPPSTPRPGFTRETFRLRNRSVLARLRGTVLPSELAQRDVKIAQAEGLPLRFGRWTVLRGNPDTLAELAQHPDILEVRAFPPQGIPPLDRSAELLGLRHARGAAPAIDGWTGRGVTIADLDSHVDVFHPDFFRGDAGYFDWIDLDGDGRFTIGADAVDLNRDGVGQPEEVAQALRATLISFDGSPTTPIRPAGFDPTIDWVYLDENADGERNFGSIAGFDDTTPALGEPLFVPDDVNGNGTLDRSERLVRLGTSKFGAVYTRVDTPGVPMVDHIYRRGVDLSETPADITGGIYGYLDTLHGSGVLGILAGGVALPNRRHVGIAPDAELLNAMEIGTDERIVWALMQSPDIVLHEYVSWAGVELDGSDIVSSLIDESSAEGVVHVCPGGNIGGAGKHVRTELDDGEEQVLRFIAPSEFVRLSLYARGEGTLSADLLASDQVVTALTEESFGIRVPAGDIFGSGQRSARDTQQRDLSFVPSGTVPQNEWAIRVRSEGGGIVIHGMLADEFGFSRSSSWEDESDDSTLAWPATADNCIAVGSVPSHVASEGPWYTAGNENLGEVRAYSARGPRIDGDMRPHVVAPDNPWSALGVGEVVPGFTAAHGSYQVFGGTSGAGPQVAGVAALLLESGVEPIEIFDRLTTTTIPSVDMPNNSVGFGPIHAAAALGGALDGPSPDASLRFEPEVVRGGESARLILDAPSGTEARWDDNYDGVWDSDFLPSADREFMDLNEGTLRVKVRVRDEEGRYSEAAALLRIETMGARDAGVDMMDGGVMSDASMDAGSMDAGSMDAGSMDSGSMDSGSTTSGDEGGCGCATTRASAPSPWWFVALGFMFVRLRRRSSSTATFRQP